MASKELKLVEENHNHHEEHADHVNEYNAMLAGATNELAIHQLTEKVADLEAEVAALKAVAHSTHQINLAPETVQQIVQLAVHEALLEAGKRLRTLIIQE